MNAVSKNVYIDKLDEIVGKYNNKYQRTIRMKPIDAKSGTNIEYGVKKNDEDPKFKPGDYVKMLKYENKFCESLHIKFV